MAKKPRTLHRPSAEKIRATLEEEIFLGLIPPGQRLDEQKEARRFGVSRTPLREALHYLASAGLLTMSGRRGAVVATLTVPQVIEMLEVLAHLEFLAAGLASLNMTDKELKAFYQISERSEKLVMKGDIDKYYHLGKTLHEAMYAGTKNTFLADTCRALRNRIFPYLRYQLHRPGRAEACVAEQKLLVGAILRRESDKAADAARDHVKVQQRVFSAVMAALEGAGMTATSFAWSPAQFAGAASPK
jgi:DNA-binding GntR family transcriptional regulator